jgi:ribosomal subunit interface protein
VYLTGRHLELDDATRDHVERNLVGPVRRHNRLNLTRMEIQLSKDAERGHHFECHVLLELKGGAVINIRERDPQLNAAIDQAQDRILRNLDEYKDRLLTLSRHPKKYSLARIARALGWISGKRVPT